MRDGARQSTDVLAEGDSPVDYEAIGDRASAEPGEMTPVSVGARNNGPGGFGSIELPDVQQTVVKVTIPPGATVVRAPRMLIDHDAYESLCMRHNRTYTCVIDAPQHGVSALGLEFLLRLHESGTGKVELADGPESRRDPDPSNDTAALTLHAERASWTAPVLVALASAAAVAALVWALRRWFGPSRGAVRRHVSERTG